MPKAKEIFDCNVDFCLSLKMKNKLRKMAKAEKLTMSELIRKKIFS